MRTYGWTAAAGLIAFAACFARGAEMRYDPLAIPGGLKPSTVDLTVNDPTRNRDIPVRVYLPGSGAARPAPVILFSHGLGGSRENNPYLGQHWSARGYVAVFMQHAGSDESVWKGQQGGQRLGSMRKAADAKNFMLRVQDVGVVLDRLEEWNRAPQNPLHGRLDLSRVGMSGHSFGAVTTQAVSGQTFPLGLIKSGDSRIKAALALSPSSPRAGDPRKAFGSVQIPWMLMTGTKDVSIIGEADVASRLAVFPALPPGGKYEVVLDGAEHSAFGERALPGDKAARNPNHHRAILALSTAFWDAYLRGDSAARTWLDGTGPRSVLEPKDGWQKK